MIELNMNYTKILAALLILSAINLTVMVPGGCVDTRDFSDISPIILSFFNIFLTTLGFLSLFLPYFILKKYQWSLVFSLICSLSYFVVYIIDILGVFPQSPDVMPRSLVILEVLGVILSIPMLILSILSKNEIKKATVTASISKRIYFLVAVAVFIGIGIVIFATHSAMNGL